MVMKKTIQDIFDIGIELSKKHMKKQRNWEK